MYIIYIYIYIKCIYSYLLGPAWTHPKHCNSGYWRQIRFPSWIKQKKLILYSLLQDLAYKPTTQMTHFIGEKRHDLFVGWNSNILQPPVSNLLVIHAWKASETNLRSHQLMEKGSHSSAIIMTNTKYPLVKTTFAGSYRESGFHKKLLQYP